MKKILVVLALGMALAALLGCPPPTNPVIWGTWSIASAVTVDGNTFTSSVMTLDANGTFALSYLLGGNPGTQAGTFSPASLPPNTPITFTVVSGSGAYPGPGATWLGMYDTLTVSTVQFSMDLAANGFGDPPFVLQRQ